MVLIIESGATKAAWKLIDASGNAIASAMTDGINLSSVSKEAIWNIIREASAALPADKVETISLYAAGIAGKELRDRLEEIFHVFFPALKGLTVESDLLAAARALFAKEKGIAAILGTGSNSCLYDGQKIIQHVDCGGYIIGDEGSAARLGKLFISDHIKGLVPKEIDEEFNSRFDGSYSGIVTKLYMGGAISPAGYLGSFAPFIMEHYDHPYIKAMVDGNFEDFFRRCIKQYPTGLPVGVVGGFGCAYRDVVSRVASSMGIEITRFLHAPIDRLNEFHKD